MNVDARRAIAKYEMAMARAKKGSEPNASLSLESNDPNQPDNSDPKDQLSGLDTSGDHDKTNSPMSKLRWH